LRFTFIPPFASKAEYFVIDTRRIAEPRIAAEEDRIDEGKMKQRFSEQLHLVLNQLGPPTAEKHSISRSQVLRDFPNWAKVRKVYVLNIFMWVSQPHRTASARPSTILNGRGYRHDVIEAQLAHIEPNQVRRAYNRAQYWPERVALMQDWADLCDSLKKPKRDHSDVI